MISSGTSLEAAAIRQRLEANGVSLCKAAARVHANRRHIARVLKGQRPGSRALLESLAGLADLAGTAPIPASHPQADTTRLISAAVHLFFLKRGWFGSEICSRRPRNSTNHQRHNHHGRYKTR